jgi:hypothetical protein
MTAIKEIAILGDCTKAAWVVFKKRAIASYPFNESSKNAIALWAVL